MIHIFVPMEKVTVDTFILVNLDVKKGQPF